MAALLAAELVPWGLLRRGDVGLEGAGMSPALGSTQLLTLSLSALGSIW